MWYAVHARDDPVSAVLGAVVVEVSRAHARDVESHVSAGADTHSIEVSERSTPNSNSSSSSVTS